MARRTVARSDIGKSVLNALYSLCPMSLIFLLPVPCAVSSSVSISKPGGLDVGAPPS